MQGILVADLSFGAGTGHPDGQRLTPAQHKIKVAVDRAKRSIPVVDLANGHVREIDVPAPHNGRPIERGDSIVVVANGEIQIAKRHREGFELYSEWCADEPEKYKLYRELMVERAKGTRIRVPDPAALFPQKLIDHRKRAETGSPDGKAWVPGEGHVDDPGEPRVARALRDLGIEPPAREEE